MYSDFLLVYPLYCTFCLGAVGTLFNIVFYCRLFYICNEGRVRNGLTKLDLHKNMNNRLVCLFLYFLFGYGTGFKMGDPGAEYNCHGALADNLTAYLKNPELSDITIVVGERQFPAHRLILSAWSKKLTELMADNSCSPLLLDPCSSEEEEVFEDVLKFMYTGEIKFEETTVKFVMSLADRLDIPRLKEMAQTWVGDMLDQGGMNRVINWLRYANKHTLSSLSKRCLHTLAVNFMYIPNVSWAALDSEELLSILGQDDIVVEDEEELIERVDDWLRTNGIFSTHDIYSKIAPLIRLKFVESSELLSEQDTSPIMKFFKKSCQSLVLEAVKYRALCHQLQSDDQDCFENMTIKPRLYLNCQPPGQTLARDSGTFNASEVNATDYVQVGIDFVLKHTENRLWRSYEYNLSIKGKLESEEVQSTEFWKINYEISAKYSCNYKTKLHNVSCEVLVITRASKGEEEFFLCDHPYVSIFRGTIETLKSTYCSDHCLFKNLSTPLLFAVRKPKKVEVAVVLYTSDL